jgi:REP element-mobilizing transposase RayT
MKEFDEDEISHEMYVHLLWSTTSQKLLITPSVVPHLYDYLCDLALSEGCHLMGGSIFRDHIQLVIKFTPNTIFSDLITNLKVASSLWMWTNFPEIEKFEWQKSEFGFTVGVDEVGTLIERIKKSKSFKEEVFSLLDQNEMKYDSVEVLD